MDVYHYYVGIGGKDTADTFFKEMRLGLNRYQLIMELTAWTSINEFDPKEEWEKIVGNDTNLAIQIMRDFETIENAWLYLETYAWAESNQ